MSAGDLLPDFPFVAFLSSNTTISDGWYEAEIKVDGILAARLSRLPIGSKILVSNAKHDSGHKEADSPLESPLKLCLHANGVHRQGSARLTALI